MKDMSVEAGKREVQTPDTSERTQQRSTYSPAVDILERKEEIVVLADMPGVDEQSVSVTLEKSQLMIRGSVHGEIPRDHKLTVSEYGVGDYERSFTLSNEIDREKIQASVKNGVLRLILPKSGLDKPRTIAVHAAA